MKYPRKILKGSKIGVCAPSLGTSEGILHEMVCIAEKKFNKLGHKIVFSKSVFLNDHGRSNNAKERAKEFLDLWNNKDIEAIISAGGGDYMMEILEYIDFSKLKLFPKLFQGCSDNTNLTFLITILADIATVYGKNFYEFGMSKWHSTIKDNYSFLLGKNNTVKSIDMVEKEDTMWKAVVPPKEYNCTHKNEWLVTPDKEINLSGRIIGGCLEVLAMLCGTKYDKVSNFIEKYKNDGIIWYIESCDMSTAAQARAIWQLKQANWFNKTKLIMFGRPIKQNDTYDINYRENLFNQLKDLNIPILFDCNIGHIQPTFYVYNGSICKINIKDKKGVLEYIEK